MNPFSSKRFFRLTAVAVCIAMLLAVMATALPQPALAKTPCDYYYKVKDGDTTPKIAHTFGLKWKEIALANNIKDPSKLKVGQILCIPPKAYTTETTFVTVIGRRIQITASGFSTKNVFYVKVRDGSVGLGGWYKIGTFKIDKNKKVTDTYSLPKELSHALYVTVCLKNATTDELICRTVVHQ